MKYWLIFLLFLAGCASTPSNTKVIDMSYDDVAELAEEGNLEAAHALCYRHIYGYDGATKDYDKAYKWCKASSVSGNSSSITLLAELYFLGNGVEQHYETAMQLYYEAATRGHSHAQLMLYLMFSEGKGTEENDEMAKYWLRQSAMNGHEQAIRISRQFGI